MDKVNYIKSLKNVKLVLGNGFDLHCGLHTTYYNYFQKNYDTFVTIEEWYKLFEKTGEFKVNNFYKKIPDLNVWDVFFVISNRFLTSGKFWCDIERIILSSLLTKNEIIEKGFENTLLLQSIIHWDSVDTYYELFFKPEEPEIQFLCSFMHEKAIRKGNKHADFYELLFDELKGFEKNFGSFIHGQLHNGGYLSGLAYIEIPNSKYINNCRATIENLTFFDNVVSIDTFNYSRVDHNDFLSRMHHINGDYSNPIFGVDSSYFKPDDKRFIFTKTSRRIDADIINEHLDKTIEFDNIIIYGHSLDEADYSYFFPLFDKINLLDAQAKGEVVFAFSIYDRTNAFQIKSSLRNAISKILTEYAKSKDVAKPERFLDSLTTQRRIILFEIPVIVDDSPNFLDEEWKKITDEFQIKERLRKVRNKD